MPIIWKYYNEIFVFRYMSRLFKNTRNILNVTAVNNVFLISRGQFI